ncbi:hypothetical protein BDV40DRAFT_282143 [Aspergillus tamarii]|uniref:Uncharacterized protein n=1 Tax=Aspergillus tamarii TaxID=41984 RepID=A0A5N6UC15_ASPTM|nr:hypothetical protein BDV40DRAFT_282143 [Aspergillus tamarii]
MKLNWVGFSVLASCSPSLLLSDEFTMIGSDNPMSELYQRPSIKNPCTKPGTQWCGSTLINRDRAYRREIEIALSTSGIAPTYGNVQNSLFECQKNGAIDHLDTCVRCINIRYGGNDYCA